MDHIYFPGDAQIVILTGAGISVESGIPAFRTQDGLWENHKVEEVATFAGFNKDPGMVNGFYNERRAKLKECVPNAGHLAIAALQKRFGSNCFLVTQNVDDLHERAGSPQVCHMHGSLLKVRCLNNPNHFFDWSEDVTDDVRCPKCKSRCRPHIVWFHEQPMELPLIMSKLQRCTYFFSVGTSGQVYPAADFYRKAYRNGAETFHVNIEHDDGDDWTRQIIGPASETLPDIFREPPDDDE